MAPTLPSTSSTEQQQRAPMALLEVARIARAHGLRGEVVVELFTDRAERLDPGSVLTIGPVHRSFRAPASEAESAPSAPVSGALARSLTVTSSRPFQSRWLVSFEGIATREAAESLHGEVLLAEPIEDPDALFVHELIGCRLIDQEGVERGVITAVQANPASDLLVVDDRYFVPVRFVTERDGTTVHVEVPEGLFEL